MQAVVARGPNGGVALDFAKPVPAGFHYTSGGNEEFLTVGQLEELIGNHPTP